jgi:hypothetical protein
MSYANPSNFDPRSATIAVAGVGLWIPGATSAAELQTLLSSDHLPRQSEVPDPSGSSIEPRARRRASRLSRALADTCARAIAQAELDASSVATVFGSTLGEAHTMITLLGQMWRKEEMSPMGFATSVHSAASGVVSINAGNRAFTTSLSADYDTVSAALFEAWGVATTMNLPTILVCGDDNSPADFVPESEAFDLVAVALALVPDSVTCNTPILGRLSLPSPREANEPILDPIRTTPRVHRNPQTGLLDVAAHLLAGHKGAVRLDRGLGNGSITIIQ